MSELTREPTARVLIGVPCQDQVSAGFAFDLANMVGYTVAQRPDVELHFRMHRSTLLPQSRQRLALEALDVKATHVLMLDADMHFPKDALLQLLARELPIVGATYATRRLPVKPTAAYRPSPDAASQLVYVSEGSSGCLEVEYMGFGCVLIATWVFPQLPTPWFHLGYNEKLDAFFGEDVWFCRHAKAHGIPSHVDLDLSKHVSHIGEWVYRHEHALQMRDQFSLTVDDAGA